MLFVSSDNCLRDRDKKQTVISLAGAVLTAPEICVIACPHQPSASPAHGDASLQAFHQENSKISLEALKDFPSYTTIKCLSSHLQVVQFWLDKGFSNIKSTTEACNIIFLPKKKSCTVSSRGRFIYFD